MKTRFLTFLLLALITLTSFSAQAKFYRVSGGFNLGPCSYTFSGVVETDANGGIIHGSVGYSASPPCSGGGHVNWSVTNPQGGGTNYLPDYTFTSTDLNQNSVPNDVQIDQQIFSQSVEQIGLDECADCQW